MNVLDDKLKKLFFYFDRLENKKETKSFTKKNLLHCNYRNDLI